MAGKIFKVDKKALAVTTHMLTPTLRLVTEKTYDKESSASTEVPMALPNEKPYKRKSSEVLEASPKKSKKDAQQAKTIIPRGWLTKRLPRLPRSL